MWSRGLLSTDPQNRIGGMCFNSCLHRNSEKCSCASCGPVSAYSLCHLYGITDEVICVLRICAQ
jgi:hypothetical protein